MRKIRIGNDIQVSWEVKTDGEAVSLEGRTLRVWVRSAYSRQEIKEFSVDGCVVTFTYPASAQKTTGARAVALEDMTEGSARRTLCADEAFTLVAHSSEEDYCGCNGAVETAPHEDFDRYLVALKSNILVGKPGLSAYDLWLKDGHTGTMEDYMKWLQQPATDAASSVAEAEKKRATAENGRAEAERSRDDAEAERNTNEGKRKTAETERQKSFAEKMDALSDKEEDVDSAVSEMKTDVGNAITEAERKTDEAVKSVKGTENNIVEAEKQRTERERLRNEAEMQRENAETQRQTAENNRTDAETLRKDDETARNASETDRIKSEKERVESENLRAKAESDRQSAESDRAKAEQTRADDFRQQTEAVSMAIKNCVTATEGAEKVNVELLSDSIRVTDRDGVERELQVTPQELVTVTIQSQVEGLSVEGVKVNVFLNNGKTPQTYTTNAQGEASFAVDKGNYYEVAVPEYATAQPISPVGYTAVVHERKIPLVYKPYDVDTSEKVIVTVTKYTNGTGVKWEGKTVKIAYDGKTTEYQCDKNGQVTTYIPYLKEYTITVDDEDGYLVRFKKNTRAYTARVTQRLVDIIMYQFKTGIFIMDADGEEYYLDEWTAAGKQPDEAVAIKIADQQLQQNRGSFLLRTSDLKDITKLVTRQWCTQNLQFTSIALNGNTSSDPNYWNGEQSSFLVMQEAKERSLSVPAFEYAKTQTLEIGGQTLEGFLLSVGQEYAHISNAGVVRDILTALFGSSVGEAYYKFMNNTSRWTSTQYSEIFAWYFTSQLIYNGKTYTFRILPSFAC